MSIEFECMYFRIQPYFKEGKCDVFMHEAILNSVAKFTDIFNYFCMLRLSVTTRFGVGIEFSRASLFWGSVLET